MKNVLTLFVLLLTTITTYSQNKNAKASFEVDGVCMMCKARIEKACITTKGVKMADWNVKTHELKVVFDERKTDLNTIKAKVVSVGHDTKELKATEEAYNKIDACCKYRDEQVVKDHQ
jgi:cation transport ATPase